MFAWICIAPTYWKLTLSTWNLVSKIPEVSTLHRSKSLENDKVLLVKMNS